MNLMSKFIEDRNHLVDEWDITYRSDEDQPYLEISDFSILAGFTGYLKFQCKKNNKSTKVYYRGQRKSHDLIPSLFRRHREIELDEDRIKLRLDAYKYLLKEIPKLYSIGRMENENLDPILQHYGIRTPWIDLVDNIFIAIWFASNRFEENQDGLSIAKPSCEKYGWIYFFQTSKEIDYYDLREHHSSLSLRLHSQHGISATRKNQNWDMNNLNMNEFICARVKFPITSNSLLNGQLFNTSFLFPGIKYDNTYKLLLEKKFFELIISAEEKHGLDKGEMGRIYLY